MFTQTNIQIKYRWVGRSTGDRVEQKSECMEATPQSDISIFQVVVDNDYVEVAFLLAISGNKGSTRGEYNSETVCHWFWGILKLSVMVNRASLKLFSFFTKCCLSDFLTLFRDANNIFTLWASTKSQIIRRNHKKKALDGRFSLNASQQMAAFGALILL